MPQNKSVPGQPNDDLVLRYLDNAVIRYLHEMTANPQENAPGVEPYDTVRGMFVEGDQLFQGSGFKVRSHVQIAVLNLNCIRGLFVPRPFPPP